MLRGALAEHAAVAADSCSPEERGRRRIVCMTGRLYKTGVNGIRAV